MRKLAETPPHVDDGMRLLARAYARLATERPQGFSGMAQIPVSAMERWADRMRLARHVAAHAIAVLRRVDQDMIYRATHATPSASTKKNHE